jgi:hypothetical protein
LAFASVILEKFTESDWKTLAAQTDTASLVIGHDRLLRGLSWGDADYEGNVHEILPKIARQDPENYAIIERYVTSRYGEPVMPGENVSTASSKARTITFNPSVFDVPEGSVESDLVAVMSPFSPEFDSVFAVISKEAKRQGFRCLRAKDIWDHSVVIQDVFSLIFRAHIVVCDFTGKNPNVFYEAGIAHTLGKHVIPITQSKHDIPFDLQHHRYLHYLANGEGIAKLGAELADRMLKLAVPSHVPF